MKMYLFSWQNLFDLGWLLFLLLMFWYFWRVRQFTLQTRYWVKTRGRVTRCEWTTSGHRVWPKIEYIYQVGERDYTGEYLFFDTEHNDPNSAYSRLVAYKVVNAYTKNEDVDVYYNPDRPEQAVLDTTIPRKINVALGFIAALVVLHVIIKAATWS